MFGLRSVYMYDPKQVHPQHPILIKYTIKWVENQIVFVDSLIKLDQSKVFDNIDQRYRAAVLEVALFRLLLTSWIVVMHRRICSGNDYRLYPFRMACSVRKAYLFSSLVSVLAPPHTPELLRKILSEVK